MSTQLATAPKPKKELTAFIESDHIQAQLAMALPRYFTTDQFTVIVRTAINKNPKLAECEPTSFLTSMLSAAQMGLATNGREAHLIPRWNKKLNGGRGGYECTFQPDYKGLVKLIRMNDNVVDVYSVCVHKNDLFKITQGLHRDIIHEPDYSKDRGEIIGVYAVILYKTGLSTWEFVPRSEVESIRARSESWKAHIDPTKRYDTPWKTDEGEMFKKTAIKRISKLADLSPDTMDRLMADPDIHFEKEARAVEIKAPSLPGQPALPEPEAPVVEDEQTEGVPTTEDQNEQQPPEETPAAKVEKQVEVKVVETPAEPAPKAGKKLLAKKPETPASPVANEVDPKLVEIRSRLEKGGWTEEQLNAVLVEFKVLEADHTVASTGDNQLNAILEYWPEVVEELRKVGAAK